MSAPSSLDNAETLRAAYAMLSAQRIDYNVRKWDVVRVASVFALGLFAASGALLAGDRVDDSAYIVAGVVLITSSAMLWHWARQGIKRESALQYRTEYSMYQIERLLGLHEAVPVESRWLPDEPYVFGDKHRRWEFATAGESAGSERRDLDWWVDQKVGRHRFVGDIDVLFGAFFLASVGVGVVLLSLGSN